MNLETFIAAKIEGIVPLRSFIGLFASLVRDAGKGEHVSLYIVGGFVRDLVLEFLYGVPAEARDIDLVVTGFGGGEIKAVTDALSKCRPVGFQKVEGVFPVIKARIEGYLSTIDIALARGHEISTGPGHRDFAFDTTKKTTIKEDLARRDFSINAIALRIFPGDGRIDLEIVDEFGGIQGLTEKRISAIGDPAERFFEDPVRQLRAIRFAARLKDLDFGIDEKTFKAIGSCYPVTFRSIPMESVAKEAGMAFYEDFDLAFSLFEKSGIMSCSFDFLFGKNPEKIKLLAERVVSRLKKDLEGERVWVPILFISAREEIGKTAEMETVTEKVVRIVEKSGRRLRLSGKTIGYTKDLARLYYGFGSSCPTALPEDVLQRLSDSDAAFLISLYKEIIRADTREAPDVEGRVLLMRKTPKLCAKEELKEFFDAHGIEKGKIRKDILLRAREKQLAGRISGKDDFCKEILRLYETFTKDEKGRVN